MNYRIEELSETKLVGVSLRMSLVNNRTGELWRSFMPRRSEVIPSKESELFSVQTYDPNYFQTFSPANEFEKFAGIRVAPNSTVPSGMTALVIPAGKYAVFIHRGSSTDNSTFEYIFTKWLPSAEYVLDDRPHFELLGPKYKNDDPNSEEEIWIPIRKKDLSLSKIHHAPN